MERLLRPLNALAAARWATELIAEFGTIGRVLCESVEARARVLGEVSAAKFLTDVSDALYATLRERACERPVVDNWKALLDYLTGTQAHFGIETTRVLFLDTKFRLLKAEMLGRGTLDEASLWPREIVKRGLELDAAGVLLAHNHPSGDTTPSRADIDLTRRVAQQCAVFGITLYDHVIVTDQGHSSMRAENLV